MILLLAIIVGVLAGIARSRIGDHPFTPPTVHAVWLLLIATFPQILVFHVPYTSKLIANQFAPTILVGSQILLLLFAWLNRQLPGMAVLGIGLVANLFVISINGGLMPISPETIKQLLPNSTIDSSLFYTRLGSSKDVLLPISETKMWWLSDRFLLPSQFPYSAAFSIGDVFVAIGTFLMLWAHGKPPLQIQIS